MFDDCTPVGVVEAQIAAWRARDAAAFSALYAPDAVIYDHPGEVLMEGRPAIEEHYANAFLEMPAATELTIANRIVSGDYVIDAEHIDADGFGVEAVVIYRVESCLIGRVDFLPALPVEQGE